MSIYRTVPEIMPAINCSFLGIALTIVVRYSKVNSTNPNLKLNPIY